MCALSFADTPTGDLESRAWKLWDQVVGKVESLSPSPLPEVSEDGSQQMYLPGEPSRPSPGGMEGLASCLSWVLASWNSSGKLPDAVQLYSFAKKSGSGPVECIITACSMSSLISWCILIASGEDDSASRLLETMMELAGPPPTWQSTSQKSLPDTENGTSSTMPLKEVQALEAKKYTSSPDLERHTTPSSRFKKKKAGKRKKTVKRGARK